MDREKIQTFIRTAESGLASARSSLLIIAQTGDSSGLEAALCNFARLKTGASSNGLPKIATLLAECETALEGIAERDNLSPSSVYAALDIVARIEAAVFDVPLRSDDFLSDIAGFVDASFDGLVPTTKTPPRSDRTDEEFEIDEETFDIFRSEAEELLENISNDLRTLSSSPGDQNALWDIRRNAHTFKGAAGIVGLKDASLIAHQMEDLLDKMVEMRHEAVPQLIGFLDASAGRLNTIVAAKNIDENPGDLNTQYESAMAWLVSGSKPNENGREVSTTGDTVADSTTASLIEAVKTASTPIVRVALDRLDELLRVSRSLLTNRSSLTERFAELGHGAVDEADTIAKIESLIETGSRLTDEMHSKLLRIRMVKFGTLETRLSRAVHSTCLDENKKAVVEIAGGNVEIDTQVIDALIEPLLHLLKNAIVHGIEPPDTRRLIGKPERGNINVRLEADNEALVLSVTDDGGGISVAKLKEKAVVSGIIDADSAASIDDREAIKLIFDRGLTTAEKIDLNAGRGVGMSIVKESVEGHGGSVVVESEPQRGTTFTILMPLAITKPEPTVVAKPIEQIAEPLAELPPLVMIVDDSSSIRRHATKFVEEAGFRVITANNGADALELLLSGAWEPDLILSDVEMPQIDGWELLEYVKTDDNFGHIPVVMITSLDADEHRERAFGLGASDYIVKPFSGKDLEKVLESFCKIAAV